MTALVTGATGFVGAAVARRLLAAGTPVRALVRPTSDRRNLVGLDVEVAPGDLTEPASLREALRGCTALYHVAADYRIWVRDEAAMLRVNVEASRDLLRAAAEAGVPRIVFTSSVAALGYTDDGTPADEETPATLADMIGPYKRSKFLADAEARRLAAEEGVPVVVVNPSSPFGPGDLRPTPTGRIVVQAARGRMPAVVDTGLNVVHVDDVAAGHLLAMDKGRIGERYVLGGDNMTLREIVTVIAAHAGVAPPRLRLPIAPLMPLAWVSERIAALTGREPALSVDSLRMAAHRMYFSSQKATRELGYAPRPGAEALRDAVDWYRANGYLD